MTTISGSPIDALMPGAALVTGYDDGRLYLGPRWKGVHLHVDDLAAQEAVAAAWAAGGSPHLFCRDYNPDHLCVCAPDEAQP